nr:chitinase POCH-10/2021 [Penicillium ochrochloron]
MKRIVSFGGWDFSTNIDTYMIFREGVAAANRDTLVNNLVECVISNALDGVDFDWEYPDEPDIPGIPAGSDEDGSNYLAFLQALRTALPDKSISISAPASYYYLKAFPIAAIAEVVDHIFYMTYDLHSTWDLGNEWAQNGCSAGDCLFSHVNLTETMWALSMITKAPVATSSIMVGVTSYGRSFEMTTVGWYTSDCTWDAAGAAGFLSGFSTGLGIAASVAPEDDGVVGAFSTSVSNTESIVGLLSISSTFTLPDESDLETALENILSQLVEATTTAITNLTIAIFEKPNQAKPLPGSLIDSPFIDTWTNTVDKFNVTIKKYMVGAALGNADYYILRDSSTAETDCTETAKYYIDGSCYTLAYPGASECIAGIGTQALATEDTITSITSYDIDMEELITNSYTCQNTTKFV